MPPGEWRRAATSAQFERADAVGLKAAAADAGCRHRRGRLAKSLAEYHTILLENVLQLAGSMRGNAGFLGFALENACA